MGIILLLSILFVIFLILFIVSFKFSNYNFIWEVIQLISVVIAGSLLIVLFTTSTLCIVANSNYTKRKVRIEYYETVESLNNTKEYIETISDDYARSIAVAEYNQEVRLFKSDLKKEKNRLNNQWINWFTCSEYKKLKIEVVDYIK